MFRIWVQVFKDGKHVASMVSAKAYERKGNAERAARERYCRPIESPIRYAWIIAESNPWREETEN